MRSFSSRTSVGLIGAAATFQCSSNITTQEEGKANSPPGELLATTVFFRHGARTPVFTSIPGLSEINWSVTTDAAMDVLPQVAVVSADGGPRPPLSKGVAAQRNFYLPGGAYAGQLTDLGIEQTKALGRLLRATYDAHGLSKDPASVGVIGSNAPISVRTTNVPRCVASAQGVLAGLFEEEGQQQERKPFPLTTLPTSSEYATPNTKACARLEELFAQSKKAWAAAAAAGAAGEVEGGGGHRHQLSSSMDGDGPKVLAELRELLEPTVFEAFELDKGNFIPVRDLVVALDAHGMPAIELLLRNPTSSSPSSSSPSVGSAVATSSSTATATATATSPAASNSHGSISSKTSGSKSEDEKAGKEGAREKRNGGDASDLLRRLDRLGGLQIQALLRGGNGWHNEVETCRLGIGRLLNETIQRFEGIVSAPSSAPSSFSTSALLEGGRGGGKGKETAPASTATEGLSMRLVSAHDTTLIPLLAALSNNDGVWPKYASYIAFELWRPPSGSTSPHVTEDVDEEEEEPLVRVVFNGRVLLVPGCTPAACHSSIKGAAGGDGGGAEAGMYRLSDFRQALSAVLPVDLEAECRPRASRSVKSYLSFSSKPSQVLAPEHRRERVARRMQSMHPCGDAKKDWCYESHHYLCNLF